MLRYDELIFPYLYFSILLIQKYSPSSFISRTSMANQTSRLPGSVCNSLKITEFAPFEGLLPPHGCKPLIPHPCQTWGLWRHSLGRDGIASGLQIVEHGSLIGRHPLGEGQPVNSLYGSSSPRHLSAPVKTWSRHSEVMFDHSRL